jgi:Predicted signal transduction protein with a C-terminal ATPase domain
VEERARGTRTITIRRGLSGLLILEAAVIAAVTVVFMAGLYRAYSGAVYDESAEVLNLYAVVADSKLSEIEALSFEILSNRDIQANLTAYADDPQSFEAFVARNQLYTQLFTRWILTDGVVSITFRFMDGTRVDVGQRETWLSAPVLEDLASEALALQGSPSWAANVASPHTITLYRLIRDISGSQRFRPLGVLAVTVDAGYFLDHTPSLSQKFQPRIVAVAGDQVLFRHRTGLDPDAVVQAVNGAPSRAIASIQGQRYFIAVKELQSTGWSLVSMLPTQALLSDIADLNVLYGVTLALVVAGVVVCGYAFGARIHQPIAQLTRSMEVVESGDYRSALEAKQPDKGPAIAEVVQLSQRFRRMVQEIDRLINEVYSRQLTIMEMRYRMLRQQINPHFLYNTLDTIHWKAIQSGHQQIALLVRSLSRLLRAAVNSPDVVTVADELRFVEDYVRIQKIRFEDRLDVEIEVPAELHEVRIPHLTLQPLVENAIVHNLERFSGALRIRIAGSVRERKAYLAVADNGRGADLDRVEKVLRGEVDAGKRSIGLRNIHTRIGLTFGDTYGIQVERLEPHGTVVTVVLPWEEGQDEKRAHRG